MLNVRPLFRCPRPLLSVALILAAWVAIPTHTAFAGACYDKFNSCMLGGNESMGRYKDCNRELKSCLRQAGKECREQCKEAEKGAKNACERQRFALKGDVDSLEKQLKAAKDDVRDCRKDADVNCRQECK